MMLEIALDSDEEWDSSGSQPLAWENLVRSAAQAAIAESAFPQLITSERPIELSVRLTSDEEVRALNSQWRGKDQPTNVLSFPMLDEPGLKAALVPGPELLLGDIIVAYGVCKAETAAKNLSFEQHAAHLLVHGTLHLLGYDHHDDIEAAEMEACEVRALKRLGIANPYEVAT